MGNFGAALGLDRDLDRLLPDEDWRPPLVWLLFLRLGLLSSLLLSPSAFLESLSIPCAPLDSLFVKRFDRINDRNAISAPS